MSISFLLNKLVLDLYFFGVKLSIFVINLSKSSILPVNIYKIYLQFVFDDH